MLKIIYYYLLVASGRDTNMTTVKNTALSMSILIPNHLAVMRYKYQPCIRHKAQIIEI